MPSMLIAEIRGQRTEDTDLDHSNNQCNGDFFQGEENEILFHVILLSEIRFNSLQEQGTTVSISR